jgi:hypothetical protein
MALYPRWQNFSKQIVLKIKYFPEYYHLLTCIQITCSRKAACKCQLDLIVRDMWQNLPDPHVQEWVKSLILSATHRFILIYFNDMKFTLFWYAVLFSLADCYQHVGRIFCFCLQSWRVLYLKAKLQYWICF